MCEAVPFGAMGRKLSPREIEIYRPTDEILHYIWDPIGVAGAAGARDEYDGYLPVVFGMLNRSANEDEIIDYLTELEGDRMGGNPKRAHLEGVVERLIENRNWVISNPDRWPHEVAGE